MKMETVIFYSPTKSTSSGRRRSGRRQIELVATSKGKKTSAPQIVIETAELTAKERLDLQRDDQVIGAAPPMPVQLIKSLKSSSATPQDIPPKCWGIEAVKAELSNFDGSGVTVAVLDTGIDRQHPAFSNAPFADDDLANFTDEEDHDTNGHGTHCAGTIFGQDVDGRRIGVARGVTRRLIGKVIGEGGGSTQKIYEAMLWAQGQGAQVISMSLGMDFPGYQKQLVDLYNLPEEKATSLALSGYRENVRLFDRISQVVSGQGTAIDGSVVVAAAGNESERPDYTIVVAPPAAGELFLSVAALAQNTDNSGSFEVASFSNTGARVAAPGVDIWSAKPGGGLIAMSGTSMAAPHVSGIAALWAQKRMTNSGFSAAKVITDIQRACLELGEKLNEDDVGIGLVQAPR
ncbi:MAG: S8 family serine peptidase [Hyphomicrobiales bacterium]|nr:S8 family serine peptidase [Hyphomicrobiales bacterium]